MKQRKYTFVSITVILFVSCGLTCSSPLPTSGTYTLIEVTSIDTNELVTDAEVIVSDNVFNAANTFEFARIMPTNESGQTFIPIFIIGSGPTIINLSLSIEKDDVQETIEIPNTTNAQVSGIHYEVKVLSNDSDPPPFPAIRTTLGSNPVNIEIFSYISFLGVCSNATGVEIWSITDAESGKYYQEEITFGVLPVGFRDDTGIPITNGIVPRECSVPLNGLPVDGFTIIASNVFGESVQTITYCIDEQGAVITCN